MMSSSTGHTYVLPGAAAGQIVAAAGPSAALARRAELPGYLKSYYSLIATDKPCAVSADCEQMREEYIDGNSARFITGKCVENTCRWTYYPNGNSADYRDKNSSIYNSYVGNMPASSSVYVAGRAPEEARAKRAQELVAQRQREYM